MSDTNRSRSNEMADFGRLLNAMNRTNGGSGGDIFPEADAEDFAKGAQLIPFQVTDARRAGKTVRFFQLGEPKDWYWQMPDGTRIGH